MDFLVPERITNARQRRGMTKTQLAADLGLTPRTIARYEKGGAPLEQGLALSSALRFPEAYFRQDLPLRLHAEDVVFRSGRRVTASARSAAVATGNHGVEVMRWLRERFTLPSANLPQLEHETPESAARSVRMLWGLGDTPLPNLVHLAESKGIAVLGLPAIASQVDAFSTWIGDQPFIFLARRRTPEGVRFDVAHELGHLVLHSSCTDNSATIEEEANRFASEFLMPTESVREFAPRNPSIPQILKLKQYFGTSAIAMARKIHSTGLASDWSARKTRLELDQLGYLKAEPNGMVMYERSRVFDFVYSPERSTRYTPSSIANDLSLPADEVQALTLDSVMGVATA